MELPKMPKDRLGESGRPTWPSNREANRSRPGDRSSTQEPGPGGASGRPPTGDGKDGRNSNGDRSGQPSGTGGKPTKPPSKTNERLAKAAETAATANAGAVAGKAAGWAVRNWKKILVPAVIVSMLPMLFVTALAGGAVSGISYALQGTDAEDGEMPRDVLDVYYTVASEHPEVPWTVLAAIGQVQTDHGRFSPYDDVDRDPARDGGDRDEDVAVVPATVPAIGASGSNQALGPMLLRPEAAVALSDPQDFEASVAFVASELARIRTELDDDGWEYDDRRPETIDRYWTEAVQRLEPVLADPSGEIGSCPMPDGRIDTETLPAWIDAIWRCEISEARRDGRDLYVVDRLSTGTGGDGFRLLPSAPAVAVLLSEARTVAYAFSGLDPAGAHATAADGAPQDGCDDSQALAGVFPLPAGAAQRVGYEEPIDRCDVEENIRVAARTVLAVETTLPETRPMRTGPYQPMSGGWNRLPWALGGPDGAARFAVHGPYDAWVPSQSCAGLLDATLERVEDDPALLRFAAPTTPAGGTAADLLAPSQEPALTSVASYADAEGALTLLDTSGITDLRTDAACAGDLPLSERSWRDHSIRHVSSYVERKSGDDHRHETHESGTALDDVVEDHSDDADEEDEALVALAGWRTALQAAVPARPAYGPGTTSALSRLAPDRVATPVAPETTGFSGSGLATGTQVVSRALYYGGLFPDDPRAGQRGSGLLAGVGNVDASALVAAGVPEIAAEAYAAAWAAAPPECGLRLELLAGVGKVETGHFTHGGSEVGPDGIVRPKIIGIPLDGTNNTQRIPDTDGGRYDDDTTWDRAVGPMQFIPTTWEMVAPGEDPQDIFASTRAAATYLCNSAPAPAKMTTAAGERAALLSYNRSSVYGDKVLAVATQYSLASAAASADMTLNPGTEIPTVTVGGITVAAEIGPQIKALLDAAAADGIVLSGYGYRSTQRQAELRMANGCPDVYTSPSSTCRVPTAIPGRSQHERGLAIDFSWNGQTLCYPNSAAWCRSSGNRAFAWLDANAHRFGLKSLPSEGWHWSVNGR